MTSARVRASRGDRRGGVPCQPLPGTREAWPQRVGWLSRRSGQTRPPPVGTLGRQNRHTRILRSPPYAVSTTGKKAMSQVFQRRARGGLGSASGCPRAPPKGLVQTSTAVGQSAFYPGQFMRCGTPGILADGATIVLHPDLAQRQSWLPSTPSREPPDYPTWDAASISSSAPSGAARAIPNSPVRSREEHRGRLGLNTELGVPADRRDREVRT